MPEAVAAPAARDLLWLACREKTCCRTTRVIVTGLDVWRIARALDLAPWDFTRYGAAVEGAADGFQLAPGGPLYQIYLAKRGPVGPQGAPCLFLWQLADGHAQCGLGALRPRACQSYPALLLDGVLCVDGASCTCRRWSLTDLDQARELALAETFLAEGAEYAGLVAAWNAALTPGSGERGYVEFCRHLMAEYDHRYGGQP